MLRDEDLAERLRKTPWPDDSDDSDVVVSDVEVIRAHKNLGVLHDALDLLIDLWPKPGYASVTLESHQWIKLRRILLEVPRLVAGDE